MKQCSLWTSSSLKTTSPPEPLIKIKTNFKERFLMMRSKALGPSYLAHRIGISEILPWDRKSYLTHSIFYPGPQVMSSCEIAS